MHTVPAARKVLLGAMTALMLVLAMAVVAPNASASFGECPSGWMCLWRDHNFEGRMVRYQSTGFWQNLPNGENPFIDEASSWANRTANDAKFAKGWLGEQEQYCMNAMSSNADLAGSGFNDSANSIIIFTNDRVC
jgi:hypothetical protein